METANVDGDAGWWICTWVELLGGSDLHNAEDIRHMGGTDLYTQSRRHTSHGWSYWKDCTYTMQKTYVTWVELLGGTDLYTMQKTYVTWVELLGGTDLHNAEDIHTSHGWSYWVALTYTMQKTYVTWVVALHLHNAVP